ncbi:MAG TPA: hypothetical protein VF509_04150, partial [Sphingobium sp.]
MKKNDWDESPCAATGLTRRDMTIATVAFVSSAGSHEAYAFARAGAAAAQDVTQSAPASPALHQESAMSKERIKIATGDGECPAYVLTPGSGGKAPAVIFYMDAGGIRP